MLFLTTKQRWTKTSQMNKQQQQQQRKVKQRKLYQQARRAKKRFQSQKIRPGVVKRIQNDVKSKSLEIKELKLCNSAMEQKVAAIKADRECISRFVLQYLAIGNELLETCTAYTVVTVASHCLGRALLTVLTLC